MAPQTLPLHARDVHVLGAGPGLRVYSLAGELELLER